MTDIPEEIIFNNILSRLPVKSLKRFRCVCKSWFELFTNPSFIKMHLKHANEQNHLSILLHETDYGSKTTHVYTMDYDPSYSTSDDKRIEINYPLGDHFHELEIYGYCNGLFCISTTWQKFVILWNPSTREYKVIPPAPFDDTPSLLKDNFEYGLCYDCKIDDYKVVSFRDNHGDFLEVMVYTLGSNSWGSFQTIPYKIYPWGTERGRMPVNGALHWRTTSYIGSAPFEIILCFDVVEERFKEMPVPDYMNYHLNTYVTALGGSLGVLYYIPKVPLDVWEMKEYGVIDSWTKVFTIDQQTPIGSLTPVQSYYNHEFLLEEDCDANWDALQAPIYVGSLVSLHSGTYATNTKEHHKMLREERESEQFSILGISD